MKRFVLMLVGVGMVFVVASPAFAQRQARGGFGGSVAFLLANASVHEELKLKDDQKKAIQDLVAEARKASRELRDLEGDERRQKSREINEKIQAKVKETLSEEQLKRFSQIRLQLSPTAQSLLNRQVSQKLELTREQRQKIQEINQTLQKESGKLREKLNDDNRREVFQQIRKLQEVRSEKAVAVLSEDQQKQFKELLGKPFELRRQRRNNNQ